ncbi:MAG: hypothetical protein GY795_00605 [Desulfobacterales bacterium]|nr:hypothetical protein [Desulfobacterales bacterium]
MTNENHIITNPDDTAQVVTSRKLSEEDQYFYEQSYKDPVESITRIEDTAKFLTGATATTSGLFMSALKISIGTKTVTGIAWFIPFICWAISIIALVLVLLPRKYETGEKQPMSWKEAFFKARKKKYYYLLAGTLFFVFGILSACYAFMR